VHHELLLRERDYKDAGDTGVIVITILVFLMETELEEEWYRPLIHTG
jgi:hypothetical protein